MTKSKLLIGNLFIFALLVMQSCINIENPYTDISNAKIVIEDKSQIKDGVNIEKGKTYTLVLGIEIRELIEKFQLNALENELWTDSTIHIKDLKKNPISFNVRYRSTGQKRIALLTYFTDGKDYPKNISIYVE